MATVMTAEDQLAAREYGLALAEEFRAIARAMREARGAGDEEGYASLVPWARMVYREWSEVQAALRLGISPFEEAT